ncbi:MAG TPA: Crp/Fnr family transcriptional regulator, partial [Pyrinomonadaceae bacterium]|nr:Crp/Fnr family transcriptional regulator [Pyrinomonadaceae bacterium]
LPAKEYQHLLPKMEEVSLTFTETIYAPDDIIRYVYFPNSGIVSLLAAVGERSQLEVGIVGNEGIVGLPVFLGVERSNNHALVQGVGAAMRMKTADFLAECSKGGLLPRILQRYTHSLMTQISQSAVCNRFHPIEARLARWLLMTADRMESDVFQITQEFLSNMLGVRREAVTLSAKNFQQNELISYNRGKISILNSAGLEAVACRCYFIIKDEYGKF